MAEMVLGIGCAHTPQIHTTAEDWDLRADRDRVDGVPLWWKGKKVSYKELVELRKGEGIENMLDMPTRQKALDACFAAMDTLHQIYVDARPDVVVIIGNDQHEIWSGFYPVFAVISAETIENMPRTEEQNARLPIGIDISDHGHLPDERVTFPGHPELAKHILKSTIAQGFDTVNCPDKPTVTNDKSLLYGMPHAYGFLYKNIMRDHVVPHVPVDVNVWHFDNTPPSARCYEFGKAVGKAIRDWESDARVVVLTTGGLTHFAVDPVWDRMFLDALKSHDAKTLSAIPQNELMAGTSECKSWIATAGAMDVSGKEMEEVDYQFLYRTEGGTGSSCAFTYWK